MAEIGTAFAVVAFADQCLKYGKKFVKRCKSYLHAEKEAQELLIAIESNWLKMEMQIEILKKVAQAGGLSKRLQDMQSQILSLLEGKLKTASLTIDQLMSQKKEEEQTAKQNRKHDDRDIAIVMKGLSDMGRSKKVKYASKKKALYDIVEDIEKWQARYDPSWILIMQMATGENINEQIQDQEKKNPGTREIPIIAAAKGIRDAARTRQDSTRDMGSIWIEADDIDLAPETLQYSSVLVSNVPSLKETQELVLIDTMVSNPAANTNYTIKEVRNLARTLAVVDPETFGLLKCRGVMKVPKLASSNLMDFKFIFDVPHGLTEPKSLRAILMSKSSFPLDERLELAKKLTSSVLFVHTISFVHKNIRPETIIIFKNDKSQIGSPFLAGFEKFRLEDGNTYLVGDDVWDHNLYRHPNRQGTHPEIKYQMQHDIYSLGVVLLEIGLWTSFILHGEDPETTTRTPNPILDPQHPGHPRNPLGFSTENKKMLEKLAETQLPMLLGSRYTGIVLQCLQCFDDVDEQGEGTEGSGETYWTDEDGVVVGVRYIENILEKMQEITI